MRLVNIIYAILLFPVFLLAFFLPFWEGAEEYGVTYSQNYSDVYVTMNESLELSKDMGQKLSNASTDETDASDSLTKATGSALRLSWNSGSIANEIVGQVLRDINAHPIFYTAFVIMLVVAITFAIISLFFRSRI